MTTPPRTRRHRPRANRRGSALFMVLVLIFAFSGLVLSAITLSGNANVLFKLGDREQDLRFAAEAALQIGKSRLNNDPSALPDTGYATLVSNGTLTMADGTPLPGVTYNLYAGPTGSASTEFGHYATMVAEARWGTARFVRSLEIGQESFVRFAYWTSKETSSGGGKIVFGGGDAIWGPVFSNDNIEIEWSGAVFHDEVATALTIVNPGNGTFHKGYKEGVPQMQLPSTSDLARLIPLATAGNLHFISPDSGDASTVRMRLEFVAVDLNADGDSTDVDEGFVRAYVANVGETPWVRGDFQPSVAGNINCGDWHDVIEGGVTVRRFFPASVHPDAWAQALWTDAGAGHGADDHTTILSAANAQCFPGGDPHLVAIDGDATVNAAARVGGSDRTFVPVGVRGSWQPWGGAVDARLTAARPTEAPYMFPLYRSQNAGSKGVIAVSGSTGVSGTLRGRITLYTTGSAVLLDDLRYTVDPAGGTCNDMLGVVTAANFEIADSPPNNPPDIGAGYRILDDTKDLFVHGVFMTLNESWHVQNFGDGAVSGNPCGGVESGRGCLYLTGGLLQERRGIVGRTDGHGYIKRYSYDRCALRIPPPYFPTTGRFIDSRVAELDPVRFSPAPYFAGRAPSH